MFSDYKAKDIEVLQGLDAVRMRPGMYIGTTGSKGLHHILWEIVDNAVDEASNGFGDTVLVELFKDGSASVEDNGRGIPVDIHPQLKKSGVEVVFTQLHAGGKFNNKNYSFSGGLHGVGASVANALSEWLEVEVYKDEITHYMKFHSYESEKTGKIVSGAPIGQLKQKPSVEIKTGTKIRFLPDIRVFGNVVFDSMVISKRLKELAFLNRGVKFVLNDYRITDKDKTMSSKEYVFEGGLSDFVLYMNEGKTPAHEQPVFISGTNNVLNLAMSFQYTETYAESVVSYVNNIPTAEGGTHETGLKTAITKTFNDLARQKGFLKDKDENFVGEDFREGLTLVLSIKMTNVQFEGQTKTKLGNPEAKLAVEAIVNDGLVSFFASDKSKVFDSIMKKAIIARRVREETRSAKEKARKLSSIENANLVGKLSSCTGKDRTKNELFIVEGDSAGGSAKQARNRSFQAILPLRGKPLNAERKRLDQVLANEEFRTIISALGTSVGEDFDISSLKYDKIIILADADQDGAHIRAILLTFFFRYMKDLISNGNIYIGMPPLFKVFKRDVCEYAYDAAALDDCINKVGKGYSLQRYKGLGEMNPDQLWDTTMCPERRTLMRVSMEDAADAERMLNILMGDSADARKTYIMENSNFNKNVDNNLDQYGV